jgi:hydrogenase maturation protease
MIRIIGIGAPFGDDAVGLEVVRRLVTPPNCEAIAADRPGIGLLDLVEGAETVILVDAVRSGAPAGTIHQLTFAQLGRHRGHFVSSHELGVAASLRLARKLGRAPKHGGLMGIEVAPLRYAPHSALGPVASHAVTEGLARLRRWVDELDRFSKSPRSPVAP